MALIVFSACSGGSNTSENGTAEPDTSILTDCQLDSMYFTLGDKPRTIAANYNEAGQITAFHLNVTGQPEIRSADYTYEGGRLIAITEGQNVTEYYYDDAGAIEKMASPTFGNIVFTRDSTGKIVRQETFYPQVGDEPFATKEFLYEDDKPVKVKAYGADGQLSTEVVLTYDDKRNPFQGFGPYGNSYELLYGYPVGNYINNVVKAETTYRIDTNYKINGEKKKKGDVDVDQVELVYDDNNYPVSMLESSNETPIRMVYSCD